MAAGGALKLGVVTYRRGYADPRIPGLGHAMPALGGRLYVGLLNRGTKPVRIEKLKLNGSDAQELIGAQQIFWWRVWPEEIPAGGVSTLTIVGGAPLLQEGARLEMSVQADDGSEASARLDELASPPLAIAYAVPADSWHALLVWLRNDSATHALRAPEIEILGVKTSARPLCETIAPGRCTIVRVGLNQPLRPLQPLQIIARARNDRGRVVEAMAPLRALVPPFPIGTWDGPTYDPDFLKTLAGMAVDGLINDGSEADIAAMDRLSKEYGYGLLSHCGWGPGNVRPFVLDNVAPKPWSLALALMDEPDLHRGAGRPDLSGPGNMRASTWTYLGGIEVWRRCDVRPTFVNLADDTKFYEFAGMTDIIGYDAYAIGAPGIERSHVGYARDLESVAYYTWDLKRCAEPGPTWVWAQGYHAWVYRLLAGLLMGGEAGRAMVTPSEMRVQLIEQLGRGAKGVWWFLARKQEETRAGFESEIRDGAKGLGISLTAERLAALVDAAMQPWDELFAEMGRLNSVLRQLRPVLTYADPYQRFELDRDGERHADVATVAGEEALVIFVANLSYYHMLQGARFQPIPDLALTVELPAWLKASGAPPAGDMFEVTPQGPRDVKWSAQGAALKIDAGALTDVKIFAAAPTRALRQQMAARALAQSG